MMRPLTEAAGLTVKCMELHSDQIQTNTAKLIGQFFTVQMDNDTKQTVRATQEFLRVQKYDIFQ